MGPHLPGCSCNKKGEQREGGKEKASGGGRGTGVKEHRNKIDPPDRPCQAGTKKDLWKLVLEPQSLRLEGPNSPRSCA